MAKPILLGVAGQAQEIVEEFDAGLSYEPENGEDFLRCLTVLATDEAVYASKQAGCRRLAQAYDRQRLARQALEVVEKAVAG